MRTCKKCFATFSLWIMVVVVKSKPPDPNTNFQNVGQAVNGSITNFQPQIPSILNHPNCAVNVTFCENIESYPYLHLKHILDSNSTYKQIFNEGDVKEELVNRQSPDGTFICRSISKTVFPKIGKNKNNKWKFIINQDKYLQGVRVETCYQPDTPCDLIGQIPVGYMILCKQKYVYSKLLSLSDTGYPAPDIFKLPSACCCAYRKNIHFFGTPYSPFKFAWQTNL